MKDKKKYVPINLPQDMVEELKLWRKAYMLCYPTVDVTYEFMIRGMLDCLEDTDPGVKEEFDKLYMKAHPEEFEDIL